MIFGREHQFRSLAWSCSRWIMVKYTTLLRPGAETCNYRLQYQLRLRNFRTSSIRIHIMFFFFGSGVESFLFFNNIMLSNNDSSIKYAYFFFLVTVSFVSHDETFFYQQCGLMNNRCRKNRIRSKKSGSVKNTHYHHLWNGSKTLLLSLHFQCCHVPKLFSGQ